MLVKHLLAIAVIAISAVSGAAENAASKSDQATADQLARGKEMVQRVLNFWDFETWNQLLAEDVTVKFKLGTIGLDSLGDPAALGALIEVHGRDDAKKVLKQVYGDLKKNVKFTGQIAYGYDVILLGELNVTTQKDKPEQLPIACYMQFNTAGKITDLTVMSVDTRPLIKVMSKTAQAAGADRATSTQK
jgi:hypothetical protein